MAVVPAPHNPATGLPWDGKDHDLVLKNDQTEYEPITMQLAPKWSPPKTGGFPWLVLILIVEIGRAHV